MLVHVLTVLPSLSLSLPSAQPPPPPRHTDKPQLAAHGAWRLREAAGSFSAVLLCSRQGERCARWRAEPVSLGPALALPLWLGGAGAVTPSLSAFISLSVKGREGCWKDAVG